MHDFDPSPYEWSLATMIRIDIFADVVCPWCYIGEKRLQVALAQRPDVQVERHWQSFQLRPELPREGMDWPQFVNEKFGGMERAGEIFEHVIGIGEELGIEFRFDRMTRAPNTADAHRLILLATSQDREWEMVHALYNAHFTEGVDLNDLDALADIASTVGMDREQTRAFLESGEGMQVVQESQQIANQLGISGVPFFIFDNQLAVSGAQPEEVFLQVLDKLQEELAAD
jgi:predicted DsbA family dithiol-disulfide isomerase